MRLRSSVAVVFVIFSFTSVNMGYPAIAVAAIVAKLMNRKLTSCNDGHNI